MNKQRRAEIQKLIDRAEELNQDILSIQEEEQEYYDNMPEGIQASEKGELAETAASLLEQAADAASEISQYLKEAMQ
jgi:ElaB/YqjD/DUF883 family membrane-anchored ribosome-binding protein